MANDFSEKDITSIAKKITEELDKIQKKDKKRGNSTPIKFHVDISNSSSNLSNIKVDKNYSELGVYNENTRQKIEEKRYKSIKADLLRAIPEAVNVQYGNDIKRLNGAKSKEEFVNKNMSSSILFGSANEEDRIRVDLAKEYEELVIRTHEYEQKQQEIEDESRTKAYESSVRRAKSLYDLNIEQADFITANELRQNKLKVIAEEAIYRVKKEHADKLAKNQEKLDEISLKKKELKEKLAKDPNDEDAQKELDTLKKEQRKIYKDNSKTKDAQERDLREAEDAIKESVKSNSEAFRKEADIDFKVAKNAQARDAARKEKVDAGVAEAEKLAEESQRKGIGKISRGKNTDVAVIGGIPIGGRTGAAINKGIDKLTGVEKKKKKALEEEKNIEEKTEKVDLAAKKHDYDVAVLQEAEKDLEIAKTSGDEKAIAAATEKVKQAQEQESESSDALAAAEIQKEAAVKQRDASKKQEENSKKFNAAIANLNAAFDKSIEDVIRINNEYKAIVSTRLQGTDKDFDSVKKLIGNNLIISPFTKIETALASMKKLAESGVAYNLEQRAFLDTVTDKIVTTFDVFDANLSRLIRLQQADSTTFRMGMEASLNKFLNKKFEDTSYLTDAYDTVSQHLIEAMSQMTRDQAIAFEGAIQKWLGSLYSVGLSQEAAGKIAEGIGYLASGNVQALTSNEQLNTLLATSANNAGLSYSDMLMYGATGEETNKLLEAMIKYLQEISNNSSNQAVKSAFGDVFGLTMSDFRAISSLTENDLSNISKYTLDSTTAMNTMISQLDTMADRMNFSEMLDNMMANAEFNIADNIASNAGLYGMWKGITAVQKMLGDDDELGDINLPFINVMGFGLDLNVGILGLIKTGMLGLSAVSELVGAISGGSDGGADLGSWKGREYTSRGSGFSGILEGVNKSTSKSGHTVSSSSDDLEESTLDSATDDAEDKKDTINKNVEAEYTIVDVYKDTIEEGGSKFIRAHDNTSLLAHTAMFGAVTMDSPTGGKAYKVMMIPPSNTSTKVSLWDASGSIELGSLYNESFVSLLDNTTELIDLNSTMSLDISDMLEELQKLTAITEADKHVKVSLDHISNDAADVIETKAATKLSVPLLDTTELLMYIAALLKEGIVVDRIKNVVDTFGYGASSQYQKMDMGSYDFSSANKFFGSNGANLKNYNSVTFNNVN